MRTLHVTRLRLIMSTILGMIVAAAALLPQEMDAYQLGSYTGGACITCTGKSDRDCLGPPACEETYTVCSFGQTSQWRSCDTDFFPESCWYDDPVCNNGVMSMACFYIT